MTDNTDKIILTELSANSRITMRELGERVHLTGQAVSARVARLEDENIIKGYTINIDENHLGYSLHVMIHIIMKDRHHQAYLNYIHSKGRIITHNYRISGSGCYLIEGRFSSQDELADFLEDISRYANYQLNILLRDTIEEKEK